ncbi:MAG: hypothetical protein IJQ85_10320 [Selenomonadaceae bacterium]|nr:hypothetical protein [Selenomonadaceae bacterium]
MKPIFSLATLAPAALLFYQSVCLRFNDASKIFRQLKKSGAMLSFIFLCGKNHLQKFFDMIKFNGKIF